MSLKLKILADYYWETKIDKILFALSDTGFENFFLKQNYGDSLKEITVVLICQPLDLKPRIRFSKKTCGLSMDILLDFKQFLIIQQSDRIRIVVEKLTSEIPNTIKGKKLKNFEIAKFENDLKKWMSKILQN